MPSSVTSSRCFVPTPAQGNQNLANPFNGGASSTNSNGNGPLAVQGLLSLMSPHDIRLLPAQQCLVELMRARQLSANREDRRMGMVRDRHTTQGNYATGRRYAMVSVLEKLAEASHQLKSALVEVEAPWRRERAKARWHFALECITSGYYAGIMREEFLAKESCHGISSGSENNVDSDHSQSKCEYFVSRMGRFVHASETVNLVSSCLKRLNTSASVSTVQSALVSGLEKIEKARKRELLESGPVGWRHCKDDSIWRGRITVERERLTAYEHCVMKMGDCGQGLRDAISDANNGVGMRGLNLFEYESEDENEDEESTASSSSSSMHTSEDPTKRLISKTLLSSMRETVQCKNSGKLLRSIE